MESTTSAYAMSPSPMSRAACTAIMLPEPPIQLPHSAPRAFQASEPRKPFMMAKVAMKPTAMEKEAAKKPPSILGPSLMILRMSQRSSIRKIMV